MASDTTDAARAAQIAIWRRMSPSERVRIAVEMSEDAVRISIAGERHRHPELTETEARKVVLARMHAR